MPKQVGAFFGGGDAGSEAAAAQAAANAAAQAELRRQFEETQKNLAPFITAGQEALPLLTQGSTAAGLDARLAEIFNTDIFGSIVDERTRAVEGQLAAGGLTRSGAGLEAIAAVPTNVGLALEDLLTTRAGGLAGSGLNAAQGLGAIGAQTSGGLANLFSQTGSAQASGILTDQQARAQGGQNIINLAATAASVFFSDPALKENVQPIGIIGDLTLCQWDWIEATKGTMIEHCGTMGFMADEVQEKYPQHVAEVCGFLCIDYPALLDELTEV